MYRGGRGVAGVGSHAGGSAADRVAQVGGQEEGRGRGLHHEGGIAAVGLALPRARALLVHLLLPLPQAQQLLPQPLGPAGDGVVLAQAGGGSGALTQGLAQAGPPGGVARTGAAARRAWRAEGRRRMARGWRDIGLIYGPSTRCGETYLQWVKPWPCQGEGREIRCSCRNGCHAKGGCHAEFK